MPSLIDADDEDDYFGIRHFTGMDRDTGGTRGDTGDTGEI